MKIALNGFVIMVLARRTFRHFIESPIAYLWAIFFYGFVGGIFGLNFFLGRQASINGIGVIAPWLLWVIGPALTMSLISDEIRTGTFESLSTLPIRDWEIVLGKYIGYVFLAFFLIAGLGFFPIVIALITDHPQGLDWGASLGILSGLFFLALFYGALGLWASSLAKNPLVSLILGWIFCTFFFFIGQFYGMFPGIFSQMADFFGVLSHLQTLGRGVWDFRDLFYFASFIFIFLYFTAQRLSMRRF